MSATAFLLVACATPQIRYTGAHAAQLSQSDLRDIQRIVLMSPGSSSRQVTIDASRRDRVQVDRWIVQPSGYEHIRFAIAKSREGWRTDGDSFTLLEHRGEIVIP